jgi:multiple sugar transport system substrate-binding protein
VADTPSTTTNLGRRAFLGLTGGTLGAGVLAACGDNTERSNTSSTSGGSLRLSQWYHQYGEEGTQQAVEGYARAYPGAMVAVQWNPGEYDQKVASALPTDGGPDIFEYGNGPSIDMIQAGQVVDMSGILGGAVSDFTKSLVQRMTFKGKLYAVPQVIDVHLLVYRKSLLQAAGVNPPTTVDELIAVAKQLTTDKVRGFFAGNDGGISVLGGPMLWAAGQDYLNEDQTEMGFDANRGAEALGRLRTLFASDALLLRAPADWSDPSAFTQGLVAMQWTGLWTLPVIEKAFSGDYGVMAWPPLDAQGKPWVPVTAYGACVSARSHNVDAAKGFVKWLWVDQTARQLDFAQSFGFHIPARKSVAARADKLKNPPASDAVKLVNDNGRAQTPLLWTPKCATAFSDGLTRIVKDGADPKGEIEAMKATVDAELERVNG